MNHLKTLRSELAVLLSEMFIYVFRAVAATSTLIEACEGRSPSSRSPQFVALWLSWHRDNASGVEQEESNPVPLNQKAFCDYFKRNANHAFVVEDLVCFVDGYTDEQYAQLRSDLGNLVKNSDQELGEVNYSPNPLVLVSTSC